MTDGHVEAVVAPEAPTAPVDPVEVLCNRIYDLMKSENHCEVLQCFEALQCAVEGAEDSTAVARRDNVVKAWGRALLSAWRLSGDQEHVGELLTAYEDAAGCPNPYLRAMTIAQGSPAVRLQTYLQQYGEVVESAIEGILDSFKTMTRAEVRELLTAMEIRRIALTPVISERIQKVYVSRMKAEDPEDVLQEMFDDGVPPTNANPYHLIFLKSPPSKMTAMDYYYSMIDLGIKPQSSTYRILAKNTSLSKEEYQTVKRRLRGETQPSERYLAKLRQCQHDYNVEEAERTLSRLELEGMQADKYVFNALIACCRGSPEKGDEFYRRMVDQGVKPNAVTFTNLITIWKESKTPEHAERWVAEMERNGMEIELHNYAALLDSYVKSNSRAKTQGVFRNLLLKGDCTVAIYNTVMKLGPFDWGLGCLACLLADGFQPTTHSRSTMEKLARDHPISEGIMAELNACHWLKEHILSSPVLNSPPRGTPSLLECMRLLLRELKLDDEAMTKRTEKFTSEASRAKAEHAS